MAISITPVLPVLASQEVGSVAPDLVLQPGSVVNAQVLKVLSAELVRIAISGLSIDVLSQVPLQQGQALQLAVSQTPDGIRLAVVGQGGDAATSDAVTLSPQALVDTPADPVTTTTPKNVLTPLERTAVSVATQSAAGEQHSLAPLFANLGALASSGALPPKLQQAMAQVLAQQTPLDSSLGGGDIQSGFQKSGLFLEASLAAGQLPAAGTVPDLKAALIVLRQALQTVATPAGSPSAPAPATPALPATTTPSLVPSSPANVDVVEIVLPQVRLPTTADGSKPSVAGTITLGTTLESRPLAGAPLTLLQEALQEIDTPARAGTTPTDTRNPDVAARSTTPPPFRGALPAAQPIAAPSIAPDAPLAATAHHLLQDTDAAIARQTLLQVASLPDRPDIAAPQLDTTSPRWNFEIPFATPQGTAMAQFEIARDGGGAEVEAAKRVWRARFSLDVEPAGPIHALVSLAGDTTSVRMWAERPATASQLRAGAAQLSQALSRADLKPGDIVIRDGAPTPVQPARVGHFLDRAL